MQLEAAQLRSLFYISALNPPAVAQTKTPTETNTKENEMTEFSTEREALNRDLRKSYRDHVDRATEHFHLNPAAPKTMREAVRLIKEDKFDGATDDKFLDRKFNSYEDPLHHLTLREHPADHEGYKAFAAKLDEAHRTHELKVKVFPPTEAHKDVEKFRTATFH